MSCQTTNKISQSLILMRGIPGSGKSTMAREIASTAAGRVVIASADDYFLVRDGDATVYRFDASKLRCAHRDCYRKVLDAVIGSVETVVVDNTNTKLQDIVPYVEIAFAYGYDLEFAEPRTPWWLSVRPHLEGKKRESDLRQHARVFAKKNTHGVPEEAILKMLKRYDTHITPEGALEYAMESQQMA